MDVICVYIQHFSYCTLSNEKRQASSVQCDRMIFCHFRYSALKKNGQRLSVLLKKGHKVEAKPARPVTVYNLSLQEFKPPLFTLG